MIKWLKSNRKIILSVVFIVITLTFFVVLGKSFALVETEKVELTGNTVNLEKKAKWLDNGSAEVTIKAKSIKQEKDQKEYQDVVFIIDTSKEVNKASISEAINEVLSKSGNKVALITYNDQSTSSGFSEDINSLTNNIDSLIIGGNRNVYKAYRSLDELLSDYEQKEDRDLKVILSVNGEANIDTPNEKVLYQVLKQKYKYLTVDSIQNNLGLKEVKSIQDITDTILIPKINTNPYTDLLKINQCKYNILQIDDEINSDYYEIKEVVSTTGIVTIDNNKINWNLDNYYSGFEDTLTIKVNLKKEYQAKTGLYKISNKLIMTEELENNEKIQKEIIDSPVLKVGKHTVTYEDNAPDGCTVENIPEVKSYAMFTNVDIEKIVPTCRGYNFKGWKIADKSIINNIQNNFIMPGRDIVIKATWGQLKIKKEADGKIYTGPTKLKSWTYNSTTDFHNSEYKKNIISVDFVDYIDLSKAINLTNGTGDNYWDLSFDNSEKVIGWLELDDEDQTKYHLYIGTDGKELYANEDSKYMFYYCSGLTSLDLSNFNTSKVTNMSCMFSGCSSLTSLNLSNFDTSNVTDMDSMFYNCSKLTSLDVSNFDMGKVISMSRMFSWCLSLISIDISSFNTSNTNMSEMFYLCKSLTSLDVSNFDTSKVTDMSWMFYQCGSLTSLDLSSFDTSKVTDMANMFQYCSSLTSLDLSGFDTSNVIDMRQMFSGCRSLTSLDVSNFDTSDVTDMSSMFESCSSLTSLDVSNFDTSSVATMNYMFCNCSSLTSLDLSNFDTSKVIDMGSMFSWCSSLTSLDVSNFDTSKVTDMSWMFYQCGSLTSLDLSSFDTSKVTDMSSMFYNCTNLIDLNISNFDTSSVSNMRSMFYNCSSLTSLDLSSFDMSKVSYRTNMLSNTNKVTTAYARTEADAAILNSDDTYKPSTYTFIVKP